MEMKQNPANKDQQTEMVFNETLPEKPKRENPKCKILSLDEFRGKTPSKTKEFSKDIYDSIFEEIEHLKEM